MGNLGHYGMTVRFESAEEKRLFLEDIRGKSILSDLFGTDLYFQNTPTMRFQFPHQDGFTWKPRIHTDIMLGHPPYEVNVWIPLTPAYSTNSMMIARMKDSIGLLEEVSFDFETFAYRVQRDSIFWDQCARVCHPVTLDYGSFLMFDPRCLHATQYNSTPHTRVSIDVRIIRREDLNNMKLAYRGTGRRKLRFAPGHYYHAQSCSELFP